MLVRFLKVWRMYQPGEVAGFEPEVAQPLIAGGLAVDDAAEPVEDLAATQDAPAPAQGTKRKAEALPVQGGDTVAGVGDDTVAGAGA